MQPKIRTIQFFSAVSTLCRRQPDTFQFHEIFFRTFVCLYWFFSVVVCLVNRQIRRKLLMFLRLTFFVLLQNGRNSVYSRRQTKLFLICVIHSMLQCVLNVIRALFFSKLLLLFCFCSLLTDLLVCLLRWMCIFFNLRMYETTKRVKTCMRENDFVF